MAETTLSRLIPRLIRRPSLRPLLITLLMMGVIAQIVALSPRHLEQPHSKPASISPSELITGDEAVLAPGIPKDRIADYTVDGFRYSSTEGSQKQWYMTADRAFLYNEEKLVHATDVRATFFDPDGKVTVVTGREAKYFMNKRDVEVFGDVVTTFPDGFTTKSEYMHYLARPRRVEIPVKYLVTGEGEAGKESELITFRSNGLTYTMKDLKVRLHQKVRFTYFTRKKIKNDRTVVESDRAVIDRKTRIATFTMEPNRPPATRFVHINEPTLYARSRRAELNYGEAGEVVRYMVAFEDVFLRERPEERVELRPNMRPSEIHDARPEKPTTAAGGEPSLRYATAGRADFDNEQNTVVLSEFPQVYDDHDTMTGDTIILHRDTDVVEVEHSNAYSEGSLTGGGGNSGK